jgi:thioredoxin reductase (NADPH)
MKNHLQQVCDCLVVGGGPAGLTAALYLARFRRKVIVIDAGKSRAAGIPRSHNHPGFIEGITGKSLLHALQTQAEQYGATIVSGTVVSLQRTTNGFDAETTVGTVRCSRVLIATGITDKCPDVQVLDDSDAMETVRYCPVCDGFEGVDKKIAVYGPLSETEAKARFLRVYSPFVTLVPNSDLSQGPAPGAKEFATASAPAAKIIATRSCVDVHLRDGQKLEFDVLYPALGCHVHSDLATALGAKSDEIGYLVVDKKQKTTMDGLYAAGDVVSDLHQLVVAEAHAAIAATAIHNSLPFEFTGSA